jgi:uncharacterized protein
MGRLFFWLLLALAAYVGYRWWRVKQHAAVERDAPVQPQVESMVRCAVCGLNLPQSEAMQARGRWYCGEEHRRAGNSQDGG